MGSTNHTTMNCFGRPENRRETRLVTASCCCSVLLVVGNNKASSRTRCTEKGGG